MAIEYEKRPVPPGLDIGELSRVLGELMRELKQLRQDFDDYTRQTHGGIDSTARENITTLQSDLAALTTRVSTLETWRTEDETKIDALYPTHDNIRHAPDYLSAVTWEDVTGKPSVFPPDTHNNGVHSPTMAEQSVVSALQSQVTLIDADVTTLAGEMDAAQDNLAYLNDHYHNETGSQTGPPIS